MEGRKKKIYICRDINHRRHFSSDAVIQFGNDFISLVKIYQLWHWKALEGLKGSFQSCCYGSGERMPGCFCSAFLNRLSGCSVLVGFLLQLGLLSLILFCDKCCFSSLPENMQSGSYEPYMNTVSQMFFIQMFVLLNMWFWFGTRIRIEDLHELKKKKGFMLWIQIVRSAQLITINMIKLAEHSLSSPQLANIYQHKNTKTQCKSSNWQSIIQTFTLFSAKYSPN